VKILDEIVSIMEDFHTVTCELSAAKYPSSSIVIPIFVCLRDNLKQSDGESALSQTLKKFLYSSMEFYLEKYEVFKNPVLISSTFLDPRLKSFGRASEKQKKEFIKTANQFLKKMSQDARESRQSQTSNTEVNESASKKRKFSFFDLGSEPKSSKARSK
jgi:hypothetical protein